MENTKKKLRQLLKANDFDFDKTPEPRLDQSLDFLHSLGWHVSVDCEYDDTWFYTYLPIGGANMGSESGFGSYGDALLSGIVKVLELITPKEALKKNLFKVELTWEGLKEKGLVNDNILDLSIDYLELSSEQKSALAALKIQLLIKYFYGGNVLDFEWQDNKVQKSLIVPNDFDLNTTSPISKTIIDRFVIVTTTQDRSRRHPAFHNSEQAKNFLSKSSNRRLLLDYYGTY